MDLIVRQVRVEGKTPILFDRYSGSNNEELPVMRKVNLGADGETIVLPALSVQSFLSAQNTDSAPKRVCGKKWGTVAKAAQSYVSIEPFEIPFLRNGKPLTLGNAGLSVHRAVARVKRGQLTVPNPKERPMLTTPWALEFTLGLLDNPDLKEELLRKLFEVGGIAIGFGTFRGVFGKFALTQWR